MFKLSGLKKYALSTGYLFTEKIIRVFVNIFIWAKVIQYLGPEQFGIFSYALSLVSFFTIFSDLGLETIVIKRLIHEPAAQNKILGSIFFLNVIVGIATVVCLILLIIIIPTTPELKTVILILSLKGLFQSLRNIDFYFQSQVKFSYIVFSQIISLIVTGVLCLYFVYLKMPLVSFAAISIIEVAVVSLGLAFSYLKERQSFASWEIDMSVIKKLLAQSWPLIISGIAIFIYMRLDQIMIQNILGPTSLGYYSAAVRISEVFYFLPMIITSSLFPAVIYSKINDKTTYEDRLEALFGLLFFISIATALVLYLCSGFLIEKLYGNQYTRSVQSLMILVWANPFVFWGVARTKWAIAENAQMLTMIYIILGAVLNVILNIILIPKYSIEGAAVATIISQAVAAVFSNLLSSKSRYLFFLQMKSLNFLWIKKVIAPFIVKK